MRKSLPPSPTPANVADAHAARVADEASLLAGRDGRISAREAGEHPEVQEDDARAIVAELHRGVEGLWFTSEADYRYDPFSIELDGRTPITLELLQRILPWTEGPEDQPEWTPPATLRLEVKADDSFWLDEAEKDPYHAEAFFALDRLMKRAFAEATLGDGAEAITARIVSVTLPEADAALAPYFVLGRLPTGELVGLRTFRVWT